MKRILCIVGCFAMGWVALPAHAQLGKLKEKLKEAVPNDKKSPDSRNADLSKDGQRKERFDANAQKDNAVKLKKSEEEGKTKLNSSNFDREAYEKRVYSKLDLDFSTQPFMPTITMQSLLSDECLMYNAVKGELRISGLEVGFLPTRTKVSSFSKPKSKLRLFINSRWTISTVIISRFGSMSPKATTNFASTWVLHIFILSHLKLRIFNGFLPLF